MRLVEASIREVPLGSLAVGGGAAETIVLTPVSRTGVTGVPVAIRVR
jgi:hypothetical protein